MQLTTHAACMQAGQSAMPAACDGMRHSADANGEDLGAAGAVALESVQRDSQVQDAVQDPVEGRLPTPKAAPGAFIFLMIETLHSPLYGHVDCTWLILDLSP